jgi:tRNA1(Val) A37 N6-methylase TrmN6
MYRRINFLLNRFTGKEKLYAPVHKRKANTATAILVSIKKRRKRLKITGAVFMAKKGGRTGDTKKMRRVKRR